MIEHPPLSIAFILSRLAVDVERGRAYWIDATKYHRRLNGTEAGCPREGHQGKSYWRIKINGMPYLRSHIVYAVKGGRWPLLQVDHRNGDSLDDRGENLREATQTQNAWNHKTRARRINLPMGVRSLNSGRFQARLAVNGRMHHLGTFSTPAEAEAMYRTARLQHYGEFA